MWDILAEEFVYAFALLTLVILVWDRAGRLEEDASTTEVRRRPMTAVLLAVGAFVAMEAVSALAHRAVMHGPGMVWHRSHHVPGPAAASSATTCSRCASRPSA